MSIEILYKDNITEWDKLERELIIDKDRKAIICEIDKIIVVIISKEVLWKFEKDDGFTVGEDGEYMYNVSKNCYGNTVSIGRMKLTQGSSLTISSGDKHRLRYSGVIMFKNISINLLIEQVEELIKEFKKRINPCHRNKGRYFHFNKIGRQHHKSTIHCIY